MSTRYEKLFVFGCISTILFCARLVAGVESKFCVEVATFEGAKIEISDQEVDALAGHQMFNVVDDLAGFTGLNESEIRSRLKREGKFHLAFEHAYWGPRSTRELAWYYRGSISYLFANALHGKHGAVHSLTTADGPILDYSGGVGTNVLDMASRGIQTYYFGVGMAEFEFTRYRARRHKLQDKIVFLDPYVESIKGLEFDPAHAVPNAGFGTIMLFDVLEHIPDYHLTVRHLINTLRPGGVIIETSPFSQRGSETAIHLQQSMSMEEAMGPNMQKIKTVGGQVYWQKTS